MRGAKRNLILALKAAGIPRREIAKAAKCSPNYVDTTLWREKHPYYNGEWMAKKRANDPAYCKRERKRDRARYASGS